MIEDGFKAAILRQVREHLGPLPEASALAPLLLARPPAEDLRALSAETLARACETAAGLLAEQRPGASPVDVRRVEDEGLGTLALITIVHDDMSFLFDSTIAEIADRAPAIHAISHPILHVERDGEGRIRRFEAAGPKGAGGDADARLSVIQAVITALPDPDADARLEQAIRGILREVTLANRDFSAMRAEANRLADALLTEGAREGDGDLRAEKAEGAELLRWLAEDNFIFLGLRRFTYHEDGEALRRVEGSELGILRDPGVRVLRRDDDGETPDAIRRFLLEPAPLIVAKANSRSRVHRRVYMDYVGVKHRDEAGRLVGETRIVGLFTSSAYTRPLASIPYLRRKAESVRERFGFPPRSHADKALTVALETYSRDEMFQIDLDLLERYVGVVVELGERPRVRVLPRVDRFDRFVSVLVFVPRESYDARMRDEIGRLLAERYDGHVSAYYPAFPEGSLATIHFIIGRRGGATPQPDVAAIEAEVARIARDWGQAFEAAIGGTGSHSEMLAMGAGFPTSYQEAVEPEEAVADGWRALALDETRPIHVDFYRREGDEAGTLRLKVLNLGEALPLSRRVPILENMGLSAVAERTFRLARPDGTAVFLHDMTLRRADGGHLSDEGVALEQLFSAVTDGRIENDRFNALVLGAGLDWREANVLRAYARHMRQSVGAATDFAAEVLERHPRIAADLFALFRESFDPARERRAETTEDPALQQAAERGVTAPARRILEALDKVASLEEDRVLRRFLAEILATLRTNYFTVPAVSAASGSTPRAVEPALAFKFDPHRIEGLPAPVPYREIFVFDARVEGVHLRFGPVARGGLRWSDRSQDYRTEVLGLVKAQQVKNAVIVPVGSKGGFFPKRLPDPAAGRESWFEAGRSAYVVFIASLLSLTDNVDAEGRTVTPDGLVRFDGEDPYFVVAADKGTATFSDTANAVALARGFWLGDAFASGGSAGYDHKAMGITARGAWEAVKRHFREMGRDGRALDIQSEPFTCVGCGDMSGDVFGNGMLLSRQTRLVAAFDHRDIFLDPDPDPAVAFAERERLFKLPRSSWRDYDASRLSRGGTVVSRSEKRVTLSEEAAAAIGWDKRTGTPAEIITAILQAPVDLLWFGGIGTYVRASVETNADVGDRANDALRITGRQIRARVVGEGANLGLTQRARIEAARAGVRLNTDAIDNSAGVNTSDVEVNIKIALSGPLRAGSLPMAERDKLLAEMTPDVARLVLRNNYDQTLALSLEERAGASRLSLQQRFMQALEAQGALDREVEFLPGDAQIADLRAKDRGLTRPELAVLLAYAKIDLFNHLAASALPDDPYLAGRLSGYFPPAMRQSYAGAITAHRLRREIVATAVANEFVNRLGPSYATTLIDATGRPAEDVAARFLAAYDGFRIGDLVARVDALDAALPGDRQNELYAAISEFLQAATAILLRLPAEPLAEVVPRLRSRAEELRPVLPSLVSERARAEFQAREAQWQERGLDEDLASDLALLPLLALLPDIERVSRETGTAIEETVRAFFAVTQMLRIGRLEGAIAQLRPTDYYETLALERAASQILRERRRLVAKALQGASDAEHAADSFQAEHGPALARAAERLGQLAGTGETSVARLTLAAGLLQDVAP
ncbi:NAD-glutamate dehydrogenase [Aureimonas sp. AU4]|uniref:NAD-glutamate dehydrogenase n=1 Tax=Aureimonas sp. AU4 TaxID=1638163 RepID=UPI0007064A0E|nr:NAD-glutamate dehydrogenase [Aureimonas sp. AU4]BAT30323.1 NAD-specific glutamate dehydrogenase [Aureimonas sp. AU4]